MNQYHLFKSKKNPGKAITIGEYENGLYFIPAAAEHLSEEENLFDSIEEIEKFLDDELVMIRSKKELN